LFKLNNPLIVLDLEATAGTNEKGYQTNNFIIDVGAVLLDTSLNTLSTFSSLVKPEEPVSEFITRLTGISNEMTVSEDLFPGVLDVLLKWLETKGEEKSLKKYRICCWGNYFDIPLLRKVCEYYDLAYPFSGTSVDIKSIVFLWHSLSGRRTDRFNVENTAALMGISDKKQTHRALDDALLETEIMKRCWLDLRGVFIPASNGDSPFTHYSLTPDSTK